MADAANISQEGKLNVLGEFNLIWSSETPVRWPYMVFVAVLEISDGEGEAFELELRIVSADGMLIRSVEGRLELPRAEEPGEPRRVPIVLPIINAEFPEFDKYAVELRLNDRHVCEANVTVKFRLLPQAPAQ